MPSISLALSVVAASQAQGDYGCAVGESACRGRHVLTTDHTAGVRLGSESPAVLRGGVSCFVDQDS